MPRTRLPHENLRPIDPTRSPTLRVAKQIIDAFSTTSRRRHPSWANNNNNENVEKAYRHIRLITIGPSHYCEKARWGLDLLEHQSSSSTFKYKYYYTEDCHPAALNSIATMSASNGQASMTPMVQYSFDADADDIVPNTNISNNKMYTTHNNNINNNNNNNNYLCDSQQILQTFCPFLYPHEHLATITSIETDLDKRLGPTVRTYLYHVLFKPHNRHILVKALTCHTSRIERLLFDKVALDNGLKNAMMAAMDVNEEGARISLQTIREIFTEMSTMLEKGGGGGGRYLLDDGEEGRVGFTAADLTFCALAAPLIAPPQLRHFTFSSPFDGGIGKEEDTGGRIPTPPELVELQKELRNTTAGRYILDMYRTHRFIFEGTNSTNNSASVEEEVQVVVPKVVNRDKLFPWNSSTTAAFGAVAVASVGINAYLSKL